MFLILLCQPGRVPDPFGVGSDWSWPLICYCATFILLLAHLGQQRRWTFTSFDVLLAIYLLAVVATWPTSFDRSNTLRWIVALFGQLGLFWALRTVFADSQLAGRLAITVFIVGIAVVQAQALAFHVSEGLSVRLIGYPLPTGWSGYPELGLLSVVQFALLIATWASLERPALRLVVLLLLFVNLLELVFLYSRMALVTAVVVALVAGVRVVRLRRAWSYIAILLATLLLLTVAVSKNQTALSIVKSTVGFGQVGATPSMRFDIWRRSVRMIRDHALSGVGLGNFQAVYEPHYNPQPNSDGRRGGHAHNLW
ncbi:MAG: O-antigen ligase family protein, partial [Acidobacteria bacterium]|nr:O-antigen ligase family protein [Acidobacteriota bacterium]